ncbi:uncharacterized protein LOC123685491 [Harmonia axyridis]|uniref:uncharacterized protein LOC123685491 n=1 Tax=Harmonia axyridis TaxID=115357 RepID=UPI001E279B24|nr:uncharacterized protein LOC123685491 [Harmonia axyridis]
MSVLTESTVSLNETKTEVKLQKFYEEEEGDNIVMEFCQDLVNNVMDQILANSLTDLSQNSVVKCAMQAVKKAVEMNYCFHNVSYFDMGKDSWKPDIPCEHVQADTWAAYRVPVTYEKEPEENGTDNRKDSLPEDRQSKSNFISTPHKASLSPSSSSQDIFSIMDYLEDVLSTSSEEEEMRTSWMEIIDLDRLSQHSARFSAKLSARLSQMSGKASTSDSIMLPKTSDAEKYMSTAFSKTTIGETEKGLCIPHVGNIPISNIVIEIPDVEEFTLVKADKRKTKVSRKASQNILPKRRSDTKLKMSALDEASKEKVKEKKKKES